MNEHNYNFFVIGFYKNINISKPKLRAEITNPLW